MPRGSCAKSKLRMLDMDSNNIVLQRVCNPQSNRKCMVVSGTSLHSQNGVDVFCIEKRCAFKFDMPSLSLVCKIFPILVPIE